MALGTNSDRPLKSFFGEGAIKLSGGPEQISTSFSKKSLPGGSSEPGPMSFSRKKGDGDGGSLRLKGYVASEVMAKY